MSEAKQSGRTSRAAKLVVGGDLCPAGGYEAAFKQRSAEDLFGDLYGLFQDADCSIVNLECPLTTENQKLVKTGSCLRADPECVRILSEAGINACNLANNHIMDFRAEGLRETLEVCRAADLEVFGAGESLAEAAQPLIAEINGIRIGVIACAEHEWSIATHNNPGANPLEMPETLFAIRDLRDKVDFLLILVHGGREHFPLPYPRLQSWCRHMIKGGGDAVICQHSHCVGGWEQFEDGVIGYGQGNLMFQSYARTTDFWHEGVLVQFDIAGRGRWKYEMIPYRQSQEFPGTRCMNEVESTDLFTRMDTWNKGLSDPQSLAEAWREECCRNEHVYLSLLFGGGRYVRYLMRKIPLLRRWYSPEKCRFLLNAIRCQTHYEMVRTILESPKDT